MSLDLGAPPAIVQQGIEVALSAPGVKEDIRRLGGRAADKLYGELEKTVLKFLAPTPITKAAAPAPVKPPEKSWVEVAVKPILNPFLEGFGNRLKERLRPAAFVGAGILATTHTLMFLLGRRIGQRSE